MCPKEQWVVSSGARSRALHLLASLLWRETCGLTRPRASAQGDLLYLETLVWESFHERKYGQGEIEVETPKENYFQKNVRAFLSAISEMKHHTLEGEDLDLSVGIPECAALSRRMCWCGETKGAANFLERKKSSVRQSPSDWPG